MRVTKRKRKNSFIIIPIVIILVLLLVLCIGKNNSSFLNDLNNVSIKAVNVIEKPFKKLNEYFKLFKEEKEILNENDKLRKENTEILSLKEKEKSLEDEITKLKDLLGLKELYTNYDVIISTVISRNDTYWFNEITIDKGKDFNINENDLVLTNKGMVGLVSKVFKNYSNVKLITSNDNEISVKVIGKENYIAKIEEYKDNYLVISGLSSYDEIKVDDTVFTSGFSKTYEEIPIGVVSKIETDSYGMSKILYVKPYEDFGNLKYVSILRRLK